MCDYSLEMYASRPAREGEQYQTTRFASGSIGVTVPGDGTTAICLACDARLEVGNLPRDLCDAYGLQPREIAVFASLPYGGYRDALAFGNGRKVSLQQLGEGVSIAIQSEPRAVEPELQERLERVRELEPA